ncbi:MAG: B12-binding domain-containing radical SAM protein [Acidimicrobiales bacterium]|nr:B12-binding domain-containing radical SAM protein [Acidimicrobiales bacterium]
MLQVAIVQQGAWANPLPTFPLAVGYLKAGIDGDASLGGRVDVRIVNLPGGIGPRGAAAALLAEHWDVLAFSVLGWNARTFLELAATAKQVDPGTLVIFGGNHVSNQGGTVLAVHPAVDIVVNGEGERTMIDLLRWRLADGGRSELGSIEGISYRDGDGRSRTSPDRARIEDLDEIPSPLLSGAVDLLDASGRFAYDVALLETNRGCPYRCSFCYWGGAVGTRVRSFSRDRLRAELELLGSCGAETVVLCDANFGMRRSDLDFVRDLVEVRDRFGAPRYLEASWTKNKSATFYDIVRLMRAEGLTSSFTLALQSLDDDVLAKMDRRNMRINEWQDLVAFMEAEGLDLYAELIWGAPGETADSFFAGYDELARSVPRIAVYPLLVLPNTAYEARRAEHGLLTVRGDDDDFEYVLAHRDMTIEENLDVQRVVFWARVLAENLVLRWSLRALDLVPELTQSTVVRAFADHIDASSAPVATEARSHWRPFADSAAVGAAVRTLHRDPAGAWDLLEGWWEDTVVATADADRRPLLRDALRFDRITAPVYVEPGEPDPYPVSDVDGEHRYVLPPVEVGHDVPAALDGWRRGEGLAAPGAFQVNVTAKVGFHAHVENHEVAAHHVGRPEVEALGR